MRLVDRVAQCRWPFVVRELSGDRVTVLNNTADYADRVASCPLRYVLSDDLTRLCADIAYSKGARNVVCADLLHVPSKTLWLEWCDEPWRSALHRYGFPLLPGACQWAGRRGVFVQSSLDGRRGLLRTFWSGSSEEDAVASSAEAYFDFDTTEGAEPEPDNEPERGGTQVYDSARSGDDLLAQCFRVRYERSWADYYARAGLSAIENQSVWRHALGTVAFDIPMVLVFLLLIATRSGLPQRPRVFERLNGSRLKLGKAPLLQHIEVRAPLLPEYRVDSCSEGQSSRRSPRLHHVRGHLVRRGNQLFWRVPHIRGNARSGVLRTRTVVWTFDEAPRRRDVVSAALPESTSHAAASDVRERAP